MSDIPHRIKATLGLLILLWFVTPVPELSVIASFFATSTLTEIPLIYAAPVSILLGLAIKFLVDYFKLTSYMKGKINELKN